MKQNRRKKVNYKGRSGVIVRTPEFCNLCRELYNKHYNVQSVVDDLLTKHGKSVSYDVVRTALAEGPVKNRYERIVKTTKKKSKRKSA